MSSANVDLIQRSWNGKIVTRWRSSLTTRSPRSFNLHAPVASRCRAHVQMMAVPLMTYASAPPPYQCALPRAW